MQVTPAPERPGGGSIPILLGGHVEPAIRRAGRVADGWIRSRSSDVPTIKRELSIMETGAREAGRDASRLAFVMLRSAFVWDDGDPWSIVHDGLEHAAMVYDGWDLGGDTPGQGFELPALDDSARAETAIGTPQEVARRLRPIAEAFGGGRDFTLVVRLHYPGMDYETSSHAIELFGEHVIPALKGA